MPLSDVPGMPQIRADRAVLGVVIAVVLVVTVVVAVTKPEGLHDSTSTHRRLVPATSSTVKPGSTYPGPIGRGTAVAPVITSQTLLPNQARLGGALSSVDIAGANLDVHAPFTISSDQRGSGNGATITDALVNGQRASIAWDAGQPLPVTGNGAIELTNVSLHGDADGLKPQLGERTFLLAPGTYRLGTSVAISTGSLATPMDSATFVADAKTRISFQRQATITAAYPIGVTGPGTLSLFGLFQAATKSGTKAVGELHLDNGAYTLAFAAQGGAVQVIGEFQGAITLCATPNAGCARVPGH